jgi:hypothetical protein
MYLMALFLFPKLSKGIVYTLINCFLFVIDNFRWEILNVHYEIGSFRWKIENIR